MPESERKIIVDGISIVKVKKLPEPKPRVIFDWDLNDASYRSLPKNLGGK